MDFTNLRQFVDLGGVFVLALVLLYQWGSRFDHIEDKMTRIITLLCLAIKDKVPDEKIVEILNEKELEVVKQIK